MENSQIMSTSEGLSGVNPSPSVEVFYDGKAELGEGPFFEPETNQLLWVDIESCTINFLNVDSGKNRSIKLPDKVGAVIPVEGSTNLLAVREMKLCIVDRETGDVVEELASVENRFNDAKCDSSGRLWTGTIVFVGDSVRRPGSLYCYSGGNLALKVPGIIISNGLGWSPDYTTMYYIDSIPKHVYAFDYSVTDGTISNQRVLADFNSHGDLGLPDGMCTDIEGRLWVATFSGKCVTCWDPKSGKLLQKVAIPGAGNITSCCFGGPDHSWLFVTSARYGVDDLSSQPNAGAVFVIKDLGTKGQPANRFKP